MNSSVHKGYIPLYCTDLQNKTKCLFKIKEFFTDKVGNFPVNMRAQ